MPLLDAIRRRAPVLCTLIGAALLAGCGSAVPVTSDVSAPTPSCTTPGPSSAADVFDTSAQLTTATDGLQYADLSTGCGAVVSQGSTVTVQYTGWLSTGKQFTTSRAAGQQPYTFTVGPGSNVIQGFNEGLVGMRVGGKRRLVIPPGLAYGSQGVPPVIPANATLYFNVELIALS